MLVEVSCFSDQNPSHVSEEFGGLMLFFSDLKKSQIYHQRPLNSDADDHRILQGYEQNSGLQVVVDFRYLWEIEKLSWKIKQALSMPHLVLH